MSQVIRRIFVAASLTAVLLVAVPAPSHAAQARKPAPGHSLVAQAWSWLESLLGDAIDNAKGQAVHRKDTTSPPMPPPGPLPPPPEQGPAIDPDGAK
jgi:hypothetical protein